MTEVVSSIRRVTDIMGEISAASSEQSAGVAQVGEAITNMDQATQQNAALVEEMAAAAASLRSQAQELVSTVAVFKLSTHDSQPTMGVASRAAPVLRALAPKAMPAIGTERRGVPAAPKKTATTPKVSVAKLSAPKPAPKASSAAPASNEGDWESF